jgi:hypothetical protein
MRLTILPRFDRLGSAAVSRSIGIRSFCSVVLVVATVSLLPASAQPTIPDELVVGGDNLLFGFGALPGVGLQAIYVAPGRMYTREALLLGNVVPRGREGSVQVAVTIGAALRVVGSLETFGMTRPQRYDVHVGVRVGPGLRFGFDEVRADRNQRFNLVFEPFIRYTRSVGRMVYVEAGLARPALRVGVLL